MKSWFNSPLLRSIERIVYIYFSNLSDMKCRNTYNCVKFWLRLGVRTCQLHEDVNERGKQRNKQKTELNKNCIRALENKFELTRE